MSAVCNDARAWCGFRPRPEAVGEPEEVDFVDGAQRLGDRALDDLVLKRRHAERSPSAIGFRDVDAPHRLRPVAPGVEVRAEVLEVGFQVLFVCRHRDPIDSRACLPLLAPERPFEHRDVDMVQQGGEAGPDGRAGRRVHPCEAGGQDDPALCPDPAPLAWGPSGLAPSLGASHCRRRRHRYYEPVRLPTSARMTAPASPRHHPPPETNPADPVGSLMFRRMLFMSDPAFDPGEAMSSRIAMTYVLPSRTGTLSAFAIFHISRLNPAPRMTPVYTSDPALPRRQQDSVPACPLRLWPDETLTHRHSSAWHDVLPGRGVAVVDKWPAGATVSESGVGRPLIHNCYTTTGDTAGNISLRQRLIGSK